MRRFVAFISVLFAFASLMGATVAHAHRYVATPIVVLNHVDADNQSIPVFVQVQQGQIDLGAGILMPCGPYHAIAVEAPSLPPAPVGGAGEPAHSRLALVWPHPKMLRPPIAA